MKARQRLDEEEREIRKKRELLEAEIEAEKAEVSLRIYEGEIGEERRDTELVISHDEEYWHPPKSQGVAHPRGTLEPLTVDHTSPLKPEVPAIPSLSKEQFLNHSHHTLNRTPLLFLPHYITQFGQMVMQLYKQSLVRQVTDSLDLRPHWITLPLELLVLLHHL